MGIGVFRVSLISVVLIVALCIPIVALIVDSPIGRAIGRRLEREPTPGTRRDEVIAELTKRLELLEGDVEILQHGVNELREENQFLQRLLDEGPRPAIRPPEAP
jgi:chaperonin cofactor prefoldin